MSNNNTSTHVTKEMAQLIMKVSSMKIEEYRTSSNKNYRVHPHRRHIRNRLFKIRDNRAEPKDDAGLKRWVELQFKPGMNWSNFTFEWDISPTEPLKVVSIHEWVSEGGVLEQYKERTDKGYDIMQTRCSPTAFTRQG